MSYTASGAHGIMFHHFHNEKHPRGQGSISGSTLEQILDFVDSGQIIPAREWHFGAQRDSLRGNEICLTFDDALSCQIDVALPILDERNIKAFWFVNSAAVISRSDHLEIFRHFRSTCFAEFEHFASAFSALTCLHQPTLFLEAKRNFDPSSYLKQFPFYSVEDKWYRFLRDMVLGPKRYVRLMFELMNKEGYDTKRHADSLWMSVEDIKQLHDEGHLVGLHSHNHPTQLAALPLDEQRSEYRQNREALREITGEYPIAASHPCNSYSKETLSILSEFGINLAFRSNMQTIADRSALEWPRQDHAIIVEEMRQ